MSKRASNTLKRKESEEGRISPPPLKRNLATSSTATTAKNSFFTPLSKKGPESLRWTVVDASLLIGTYHKDQPENQAVATAPQQRRVAAFDYDSTLVEAAQGKQSKTTIEIAKWRWWDKIVPKTLRQLHAEKYAPSEYSANISYHIIIVTSQSMLDLKNPQNRLPAWKMTVSAVLKDLDIPVSIYAATEKDRFRKPRTGIWQQFLKDKNLDPDKDLDLSESFFVGDAAGRGPGRGKPKDFAVSDRDFAANIGLTFLTPEEYFLKQAVQPFERVFEPLRYLAAADLETASPSAVFTKSPSKEMVLFVGSPGSGKSTFYAQVLEPLGYERINQDKLKTRQKCMQVAEQALNSGQSVAIDNTNPDKSVRLEWVVLARKLKVPIRVVHFTSDKALCRHNDAFRACAGPEGNPERRTILPGIAFNTFWARFEEPIIGEGFQEIITQKFKLQGSDAQRALWSKYWAD